MITVKQRFDFEEICGVTIAKFVDKRILDEANIGEIGDQMFALFDKDHRRKVVLDFSNVEYLSSAAIGKLMAMEKKAKAAKAKLRLCHIRPEISEVFALLNLYKTLDIKVTLDEALLGI